MKTLPNVHPPIIQTLLDEHLVIQSALSVLMEMATRVTQKRTVKTADLRTIVKFFRDYADGIHHHTEEEVLFAKLQRSRVLKPMIRKLLTQHTMGRIFVGEMSEASELAVKNARGWRQAFVRNATAYHTLLAIHICDEDHVFFPRSEILLRGTATRLLWRPTDTGKKLKLEQSVHRLSEAYTPSSDSNMCCGSSTCVIADRPRMKRQTPH